MMRLDRYLSQATALPRSHALTIIRAGRVQVDAEVVRDPARKIDADRVQVHLDQAIVKHFRHLLLILHKPAGYVTTTEQGRDATVMELIPLELQHKDLAPIGRLDKDTTGLLLLTTDGALNHALTHPKRHIAKVYVADIEGNLLPDAVQRFADGVRLADGTLCKPAELTILSATRLQIVLHEGRFHQVKRMTLACNATVTQLHRHQIGQLQLPPSLPIGEARPLLPEEIALLGIDWQPHGD